MRSKILFILFVYCLIISVNIGKAEGLKVDGYKWQKWNRGEQISFVFGWLKSGNHAFNNLSINVNKWNESMEFVKLQQSSFINAGVLLGGVTVGQVIDTINFLYSDPRVMTMDISNIMPFVSGRLIQGWTTKDLDELIAIEVKLQRCEKEEKAQGHFIEECSSVRKYKNSYLQKLKKNK